MTPRSSNGFRLTDLNESSLVFYPNVIEIFLPVSGFFHKSVAQRIIFHVALQGLQN